METTKRTLLAISPVSDPEQQPHLPVSGNYFIYGRSTMSKDEGTAYDILRDLGIHVHVVQSDAKCSDGRSTPTLCLPRTNAPHRAI